MFNDITKPPPPLPSPELTEVAPGVSLLRPLSRRGAGPGVVLLTADHEDPLAIRDGVPSPLVKWAEEGYAVVEIQAGALAGAGAGARLLRSAVEALEACERCEPKGKVGLVAYEPGLWNTVAPALGAGPPSSSSTTIVAAAVYANAPSAGEGASSQPLAAVAIPVIHHLAGRGSAPPGTNKPGVCKEYFYPNVDSYRFATPFQSAFHYNTENISHTRNLTLLKEKMGGPYFDLETIWEEHTYYEFADRSMEHTMSTMVQEPYVNHVPTMTGGIGRARLSHFYQHNFIFNNSADTELELISRTMGIDRIVDEFIFKFTHDQMIDWILPGIPPTHKKVEIPFTAVVNIRGDRLYHEHIAWDQSSVLRQVGLLPEYLPYPYALPGGATAGPGRRLEYRLPVAGVETADKMRDRNAVASNEMFGFKVREV